jgi:hypothetical protein
VRKGSTPEQTSSLDENPHGGVYAREDVEEEEEQGKRVRRRRDGG